MAVQDYQIYEEREDKVLVYVGTFIAENEETALFYARQMAGMKSKNLVIQGNLKI